MNKQYLIKHKDLVKLINKFEEFKLTFETFILKHKNYAYEANIDLIDDIWECKITVKDESENNKISQGFKKSHRVL